MNPNLNFNSTGSIIYYDVDNELLGSDKFIDGEEYTEDIESLLSEWNKVKKLYKFS